jgi:hypothetical protein
MRDGALPPNGALGRRIAAALAHLIVPIAAAILCVPQRALATDLQFSIDTRLLVSDGQRSFLDGGLGALRYGADRSGIQLGRVRLAVSQPIGDILALRLDASSWGGHEKNPLDLTEAYLELRPYPRAGFRLRVKAGAFYAPISLENGAAGWESPYTLTPSAIDSWIAEELRTIGVETRVDWLGTRLGHDFDLSAVGAAFGWNESAGIALASHGFALNDRQTTLFGRVGLPTAEPVHGLQEFREIDGRVGTYEGVEARWLDRVTLRVLHYDNHADPAAFDAALGAHAWATRFDSVGVRALSANGWTAIFQWMGGETYTAPGGLGTRGWPFRARYLLVARRMGRHTVSVRYDEFEVDAEPPTERGIQHGHATTVAYIYEPGEHWRFTLEWLRVRSSQSNRRIFLQEAPLATGNLVQLAVRYAVGASWY